MSTTDSISTLIHKSSHKLSGQKDSNSRVSVQRVSPGITTDVFKFDSPHSDLPSPVALQPRPIAASAEIFPKHAPAALRKRFYPAQWRKISQPQLESLVASRGLRMEWVGWEMSLPRVYLPLDGLTRLMTEAIDAVSSQIDRPPQLAGRELRPISLRVSSQRSGVSGNLILVIEHDRWHCDSSSQAALNSTSLLTSADMRMDRLRRQVMNLGGMTSLSPALGGGARLRISLPIDEPRGLVKAWLDQCLTLDAPSAVAEQTIGLFIVGRRQIESPQQQLAADQRLQSLVEPGEFIYRTAADRWLWLRTQRELPAFARTHAWLISQVAAWRVKTPSSIASDNSQTMRWQLAGSIAMAMQRLIGTKVAPLDSIVNGLNNQQSKSSAPKINPPHQKPIAKARWRYPI